MIKFMKKIFLFVICLIFIFIVGCSNSESVSSASKITQSTKLFTQSNAKIIFRKCFVEGNNLELNIHDVFIDSNDIKFSKNGIESLYNYFMIV